MSRAPRAATGQEPPPLKKGAQASAVIFLIGVALVVLAGIFPALRTVAGSGKEAVLLSMPITTLSRLRWEQFRKTHLSRQMLTMHARD